MPYPTEPAGHPKNLLPSRPYLENPDFLSESRRLLSLPTRWQCPPSITGFPSLKFETKPTCFPWAQSTCPAGLDSRKIHGMSVITTCDLSAFKDEDCVRAFPGGGTHEEADVAFAGQGDTLK